MVRRSIWRPRAASASATSMAVTDPYSLSCSPTLRFRVTGVSDSRFATASADAFSFAAFACAICFWCSSSRTFFGFAATASPRGRRKFRP